MNKLAITRLVKEVVQSKLPIQSAGRAAKKLNLKSRFIKRLGTGKEGVADLMIGSRFPKGVGVAKSYDLKSPWVNPSAIKVKSKILEQVAKPQKTHFAKYYGKHKSKPITYHEYINPKRKRSSEKKLIDILAAQLTTRATTGKNIGDIHFDNVVGKKVVDFMARGKILTKAQKTNLGLTRLHLKTRMASSVSDESILKPIADKILKSTEAKRQKLLSRLSSYSDYQVAPDELMKRIHNG